MMINIGGEVADIHDNIDGSSDQRGRRGSAGVKTAAAASNSAAMTTTSSWSRLKDPRIVRVSRAFGGKDRHSKVCTVRGLRDRRVRLSVPTAIQLYDLQDRLGLNQPSKVVDWLLNAAKHEIDELPPLQIPPSSSSSNFIPTHNNNTNYFQSLLLHHQHNQPQPQPSTSTITTSTRTAAAGLMMKIGNTTSSGNNNWDVEHATVFKRNKLGKEEDEEEEQEENHESSAAVANIVEERLQQQQPIGVVVEEDDDEDNDNDEEHDEEDDNSTINNNGGNGYINIPTATSNNFISSVHEQQQYMNNSLIRWDPSTLSLAQTGHQQPEEFHNNINVMSLGHHHHHHHHHHQVLVYQPVAAGTHHIGFGPQHQHQHQNHAAGAYFSSNHSHITTGAGDTDDDHQYVPPKPINFQMLMSSCSNTTTTSNSTVPSNNHNNNNNNHNSMSNSLRQSNDHQGRPFHFTTNFLPTHKDCGK